MPRALARRCVPISTARTATSHDVTPDMSMVSSRTLEPSTPIRDSRSPEELVTSRTPYSAAMVLPSGPSAVWFVSAADRAAYEAVIGVSDRVWPAKVARGRSAARRLVSSPCVDGELPSFVPQGEQLRRKAG